MTTPWSGAPLGVEQLGRVHFIGIGGAGMSGVARVLLGRGLAVSGSDLKDSRVLAALRVLGADVFLGHDVTHLDGVDTVVVSSAIRDDNLELTEAHRRGLRVLPRAAVLAALMTGRRGVAVAGTHGKTTTTSMLSVALQAAGADPSFVIGGDINEAGSNAHHGTGDIVVAEADESDGSFLLLRPYAAVITNVELDHPDHYADLGAVQQAFEAFVGCIDPAGFVVLGTDDPGARALRPAAADRGVRVISFGTTPDADFRLAEFASSGGSSTVLVARPGGAPAQLSLVVPGRHNAFNAIAALATALELGADADSVVGGLAEFRGARRRFEPKGTARGVRVFDDYAHNPTKVRAALEAAREVAGDGGRVLVAFQPHRYTRTAAFAAELGAALGGADEVVVMEVYAAGEPAIPGATGAAVAAAVPLPVERVLFEPSWSAVPRRLAERARPGDVVLTLGAGDVTMLGPELLALLAVDDD